MYLNTHWHCLLKQYSDFAILQKKKKKIAHAFNGIRIFLWGLFVNSKLIGNK